MSIQTELEEVHQKAAAFDTLRRLCGYVENGTDVTVRICQDDATKTWIVGLGHPASGLKWCGECLRTALAKAGAANPESD